MKRIALPILAAALAATAFAGGTAEAPAASGPVTLRYWQHSSAARDEMMTKLVADFEAKNPGVKVVLEFIPEADYNQKLIPALATSTAPDVFQVQMGMVAKLADAGAIQPLDEKVMSTASIQKDFVPATVDGLKIGGKYYGMPTDTQTIVLLWNKDLVRKAGLDAEKGPQTWDEFFDWSRKLTKTDAGAMVQSGWGGKGYWPEVVAYVHQMGGRIYDEKAKKFVFADDAKSVRAFKTMTDLYKVDKVYDLKFSKNWAGFRQGLIGLMLGHPAMIGNLPKTAPNLDFGVGLIPAAGKSRATCVTSWAYVASARAPSAAATRFIEFLGSEEVERMWTEKTGELPARKALLEDPALRADPKIAVAISSLKDSFVGQLQTAALSKIWGAGYERILLTDDKLEDVLRAMQDEMNAELSNDI